MAKTQNFKTESQKLLHLMTHSIYTQKGNILERTYF